ncbi:zinc ribbon domain-containing protein [Syntrophobacter fumaroxidans]|uniref:zinc ribbon domain-containing protein n=1 Tax=Syntrophobacter fumaroxidans TaxID=119484 RepID=UPI0009FD7A0C
MFFFIGGVQPKTITLDQTPRLCTACGLAQARLKRVDHYLSLFFIPLIPVKRGEPMVVCDRCGAASSPDQPPGVAAERRRRDGCSRCGYPVEADFRYCPQCGSRI